MEISYNVSEIGGSAILIKLQVFMLNLRKYKQLMHVKLSGATH